MEKLYISHIMKMHQNVIQKGMFRKVSFFVNYKCNTTLFLSKEFLTSCCIALTLFSFIFNSHMWEVTFSCTFCVFPGFIIFGKYNAFTNKRNRKIRGSLFCFLISIVWGRGRRQAFLMNPLIRKTPPHQN